MAATRTSSRKPTAAERELARDVSLRRILGALPAAPLGPRRSSRSIIVASSIVLDGLALPARAPSSTTPCPGRTCRLLAWLVVGMVAVAAVTAALGVVQTWISTKVGQQVMHSSAHRRLRPPAAPVARLLHPDPHRRGAVPDHQRHRRHGVGRHLDRHVDRRRTSPPSVATAVAMVALSWRLSLISLVVMPPAIYLTRRVARMRRDDHHPPPARAGRPQRHDRGGPVGQRHPPEQDDGRRRRP